MRPGDQHPISGLRRHCRMYLYGSGGSPELMTNEVAQDFFSFALLHLTCTMFITTDHGDPRQGIFHRTLDPIGQSHLLTEVDDILNSLLGKTTLRQFLRSKRNKLATHGTVTFSSQPRDVQDVTFDEESLHHHDAMTRLESAVFRLERELAGLEPEQENPEPSPEHISVRPLTALLKMLRSDVSHRNRKEAI